MPTVDYRTQSSRRGHKRTITIQFKGSKRITIYPYVISAPGDVEGRREGSLGKGGHVGEGLEGIIHKAMKHGVHEAKIEIHGLGDGKLGVDLEAIIRRAKEQAHRKPRGHDEADRVATVVITSR